MTNYTNLKSIQSYAIYNAVINGNTAEDWTFKPSGKMSKESREALSAELAELGGVYSGKSHAWLFGDNPRMVIDAARRDLPIPDTTALRKWAAERNAKAASNSDRTNPVNAKIAKLYDACTAVWAAIADNNDNAYNAAMTDATVKFDETCTAWAEECKAKKIDYTPVVRNQWTIQQIMFGLSARYTTKKAIKAEKDFYAVSKGTFRNNVRAYLLNK